MPSILRPIKFVSFHYRLSIGNTQTSSCQNRPQTEYIEDEATENKIEKKAESFFPSFKLIYCEKLQSMDEIHFGMENQW